MKNMLLVAILIFTQTTFAIGTVRAVEVKNKSTHLTELKKNGLFEEISRKMKSNTALNEIDKTYLAKATSKALEGISVSADKIKLLVHMDPELLADIKAKADVINSTSSSAEQKDQAELDLQVLDVGAGKIDVNSLTAKKDAAILARISRIEKYPNSSVATFKAEYIKALENGSTIKDGVQEASKKLKKQFTAEKLEELCS